MEDNGRKRLQGHVEAELFSYLHGELSPETRKKIDGHLRDCPSCRAELREIRNLEAALGKNRTAFCPASSELYEYAKSRRDPNRTIEPHLRKCEMCRSELAEYAQLPQTQPLPEELWEKIKGRLEPRSAENAKAYSDQIEKVPFLQRIFGSLKLPAAVTATVAAALLVFIFYPSQVPNSFVGLTSSPWEQIPKSKTTIDTGKQRVGFIVMFKEFKKAVPQSVIDLSYKAVTPDIEIVDQYDVIDPSVVSRTLRKSVSRSPHPDQVLEILQKDLGATVAVVMNVSPSARGFDIHGSLIDTSLRKELKAVARMDVDQDQLGKAMRELTFSLLLN